MTDTKLKPAARPVVPLSRAGSRWRTARSSKAMGFGASTQAVGEVCFNTAMTGYQEILTDPSYAGQIVCFTFPHIGIVGTNDEDIETHQSGGARAGRARRCRASLQLSQPRGARCLAEAPQHSRPWRASTPARSTSRIREKGMPHGVIAHGDGDAAALREGGAGLSRVSKGSTSRKR